MSSRVVRDSFPRSKQSLFFVEVAVSERGKQFSSRFWEPYDELVVEKARAARLKPNQLVRIATMSFVDQDLLAIHERVATITSELRELREQQAALIRCLLERVESAPTAVNRFDS